MSRRANDASHHPLQQTPSRESNRQPRASPHSHQPLHERGARVEGLKDQARRGHIRRAYLSHRRHRRHYRLSEQILPADERAHRSQPPQFNPPPRRRQSDGE